MLNFSLLSRGEGNNTNIYLSLTLIPFVWGDVLPATSSPPHLIVFSTLLCLLSGFFSLPPLLPSSHLSSHSHTISALASLVSYCPAHVTLPLSSVASHPPSFQRVIHLNKNKTNIYRTCGVVLSSPICPRVISYCMFHVSHHTICWYCLIKLVTLLSNMFRVVIRYSRMCQRSMRERSELY